MKNCRTIELNDDMSLKDSKDIKYLTQNSGVVLKGLVEITNEFGEVLLKKHNLIVVPGRVFVLEKLFNINSPVPMLTLHEQLDMDNLIIPRNNGPEKDESVCLFMIGKGGSELVFGEVNAPGFKDTLLFDPIPFRFVDTHSDLTATEKEKYFLRMETANGQIAYFCKKFEKEPEIKIKRIGTDIDVNLSSPDEDYDIYVDINLKVDTSDLREYFIAGEGIERARFNEIGLVIGQKPKLQAKNGEYVDYANLQLFTKLTFNNEALDSNTKELNINYRIYA